MSNMTPFVGNLFNSDPFSVTHVKLIFITTDGIPGILETWGHSVERLMISGEQYSLRGFGREGNPGIRAAFGQDGTREIIFFIIFLLSSDMSNMTPFVGNLFNSDPFSVTHVKLIFITTDGIPGILETWGHSVERLMISGEQYTRAFGRGDLDGRNHILHYLLGILGNPRCFWTGWYTGKS